jgi:HEXXH motif-containing protein
MTPLQPALATLPGRAGDPLVKQSLDKLAVVAAGALLRVRPEGALGRHVLRLQAWLTGIGREALLRAFRDPIVQGPLLVLHAGLRPADSILRAVVPDLLAALQPHVNDAFVWEQPVRRIHVDSGVWTGTATAMLVDPLGIDLRLPDGSKQPLGLVEACTFEVAPGLVLRTSDTNPLAMDEAHPDKQGNAVDLGDRTPADWCAALRKALAVIRIGLPALAQELRLTLRQVVPVGVHDERHLSASYREVPRLAYLSLHPSTLTMAEAVVHEAQHSKLNAVMWRDPLIKNGRSTWTQSPVRPDLRPLLGVLLAVHAFVPVAALHAELARLAHPIANGPEFATRRQQVLESNARGLMELTRLAEPTALGERVLAGLGALHGSLVERAGGVVAGDQVRFG